MKVVTFTRFFMASTRIKKVGGVFKDDNFKKLVKKLNGRAILVVALVNGNCQECEKLMKFIKQLENGFIDRLPQLFMLYGFSDRPINNPEDDGGEKASASKSKKKDEEEEGEELKDQKVLGDSRFMFWDSMPEHHGYAIFTSETDVLFYNKNFEHDDFVQNIVDSLRRFKSSIRTLQGLSGKRDFLKKQRSGIIIETNGTTQQSQIMSIENYVKEQSSRIKIPVYFCKGLAQEISLVKSGDIVYKQKGLKFEKFVRKIPKFY